jgi:hypothetical protein
MHHNQNFQEETFLGLARPVIFSPFNISRSALFISRMSRSAFAHRAFAARLADCLRCCFVSFAALALPPILEIFAKYCLTAGSMPAIIAA